MSDRCNVKQFRRGFTLIELLTVITIIAILMGMSVVVLYGVTDSAQEQATITTIQKVHGLLEQRTASFERAFSRTGTFRQRYIDAANAVLDQRGVTGIRQEVTEILALKIAFRHQFPQRHEDLLKLDFDSSGRVPLTAYNVDTLLAAGSRGPLDNGTLNNSIADNEISDYVDATRIEGAANTPDSTDNTVSSELLYYALITSGNFGAASSNAQQFLDSEVADTDDDGLLEFVDAYGNPLRFYRWPTRLMDPDTPFPFTPDLADPNEATDVRQTVETAPSVFTTVGVRQVTDTERTQAEVLIKGLPPSPANLPNGALPRDLMLIDPDDPVGRLYAEMERVDGAGASPVAFSAEYNEVWYHSPETFHTSLIVSAGPDGVLGMHEPNDTTNFGHLANFVTTGEDANQNGQLDTGEDANSNGVLDVEISDDVRDNITNRNRRMGGRR